MPCSKILMIFVFIGSPCLVFSQSNYEPGHIVLQNGKEIPGLINYQNWEKNPKTIEFKTPDQNVVTTYSVTDLKSFDVTGKDRYESFIVDKMIAPIDILEVDKRSVYTTVRDTVFLRVLLLGNKLDLYELYDERMHFYVKQPETDPVELQYKVTLKNAVSVIKHTIYREQLKVLTDNSTLQTRIENSEYSAKDIARIVKQMNSSIMYQAPDVLTSKGLVKVFIGAGTAINSLDISGANTTLSNMKFNSTLSYIATAGIDLLGARGFSRFRARIELSLSAASYTGTTIEPGAFSGQMEKKQYSIKQNHVIPGFSIMYSPFHSKKIDAFVGAATGMYFTKYRDNTLTTTNLTTGNVETKSDYLALSTSWISSDIRAGIRTKHLEFIASSKIVGSFFNFDLIFGNVRTYSFRLLYSF